MAAVPFGAAFGRKYVLTKTVESKGATMMVATLGASGRPFI